MTAVAHKSALNPTPPRARKRAGGGDAVARSGACEGRGGDKSARERRDIVSGEVLPDNRFRVILENGFEVWAYSSGRLKKNRIRVLAGDRVTLEMSPYDLTKGRITYRHK